MGDTRYFQIKLPNLPVAVSIEPPTPSTPQLSNPRLFIPAIPPKNAIYRLQINRVAGEEVSPSQTAPYCESRGVGKRLQINKYISINALTNIVAIHDCHQTK